MFTGRNEVVAKVMFLLVSVILSTGGGSASVHTGMLPPSPRRRHPPKRRHPPRRRHPPVKETPLQAHTQGEIEGDQVQAHTQEGN